MSGTAPLFGLRWVPDSQLRPLRYLPNPQASPSGSDWWVSQTTPRAATASTSTTATAAAVTSRPERPSEAATPTSDAEATRLRQSVRTLTQRLGEAHESVRQKVEQIRWLKEMTKDDASRARVARWMRGPLLRVFVAWKRLVRDSVHRSLVDLQSEFASSTQRHRELQARCDDLSREHAVLQAALEHFFGAAQSARGRQQMARCWRRWAPLRLEVAGRHKGGANAKLGGGLPRGVMASGSLVTRRAHAARAAIIALRRHARRSLLVDALARRTKRRNAVQGLRVGFDRFVDVLRGLYVLSASEGAAARAVRLRSALRIFRRRVGQRTHMRALEGVLRPHNLRRGLRFFWCRWTAEAVRRLSSQRKIEASRARRAQEELLQQSGVRAPPRPLSTQMRARARTLP